MSETQRMKEPESWRAAVPYSEYLDQLEKVRAEIVRRHEADLEKWDTERRNLERQMKAAQAALDLQGNALVRSQRERGELARQLQAEREARQRAEANYKLVRDVPRAEDAAKLLIAYQEAWELEDTLGAARESRARLVALVRAKNAELTEWKTFSAVGCAAAALKEGE